MNRPSRTRLGTMLAAAAVVMLAGGVYYVKYLRPKAELTAALQKLQTSNAAFEKALLKRSEIREGMKAVAATTLGASKDEVDDRFRRALHAIAASCALTGISVNTETPDKQENPLTKARFTTSEYGPIKRDLGKNPDFSEIPGTLTGIGSLEQVLRATALVKQQPWVHRVQSFSIKPENKERTRFTLKLGVSTILLPPDLAPKDRGEPLVLALSEGADAAWKRMVQKNIFREPPPPPPRAVAADPAPAPPPAPAPSAPPRPPYDDWRLTGVVQSRLGIEAFLVNTKSGERLTLPTGSAVADARFIDGEGERAIFEIEGKQFEIINGQTLEQRRPLTR